MTPDDQSRPTRARLTRRAFLRTAGGTALVAGRGGDARVAVRRHAGALSRHAERPRAGRRPPKVSRFAADWPTPQGNLAAHRAAADSPIAAANVDQLRGRLAPSAHGGRRLWRGDRASRSWSARRSICRTWRATSSPSTARRARPLATRLGHADRLVRMASRSAMGWSSAVTGLNAEAFALDAATGEELWRIKLSANPDEFIFMQPLVYDNVVYIGTSPGAYVGGTRGILFALDAGSGAVLWQWDTTTDNLWGNARLNAGGGVWYPPSVDDAGQHLLRHRQPGPLAGVRPAAGGKHPPRPEPLHQLDGLARPHHRRAALVRPGQAARSARPRLPAHPDPGHCRRSTGQRRSSRSAPARPAPSSPPTPTLAR